jgi:alanine-glyoxylate transaminase / serine-glyoxylate transaminase / serine-pyruvate transaminase
MPSFAPPRRFLFGPGPTQVEPRVYEAMSQPVTGYLDPFLFQVFDEIRRDLRAVFGTANPATFPVPGTGSAGMEAAVTNFTGPGVKFAVFVNGYFGERIVEMGRRSGALIVRLDKAWGETFQETDAREFLERERPQIVAFVHGETSTGALQSPEAITEPAHAVGALVIGDCVTTLGSCPIHIDKSGIDIAYSCTQKGLSAPPGLSPFTYNAAAADRLKGRVNPVWYLDLNLLEDYYDAKKYHHTPPVSTHYALREALAAIRDEGVEQRFIRHAQAHASFVRRVKEMGLSMLVEEERRLPTLNTVRVPEGVDDAVARKKLLDEYGIEIAGGLGPLAGKIFRIGVMGPLATESSLDLFFKAFTSCVGLGSMVKT